MASHGDRVPIPGSAPEHPPGARLVGPVEPDSTIEVTVMLRPRPSAGGPASVEAMSALPIQERHYPSREEYQDAHGADPGDVAKVEAFARAHGLEVEESSAETRSVVLSGSAQALAATFGVSLGRYEAEGASYRGASGPAHVPPELATIVQAVVGLDDRPRYKPK
jgi:kumamolisin